MTEIVVGSITLALIVLFTVFTQISVNCPMCGKGLTITKPCDNCRGLGKVPGTFHPGVGSLGRCHICNGSGSIEVCAFCVGKKQISLLNWIVIKLTKRKIVRF